MCSSDSTWCARVAKRGNHHTPTAWRTTILWLILHQIKDCCFEKHDMSCMHVLGGYRSSSLTMCNMTQDEARMQAALAIGNMTFGTRAEHASGMR